MYLLGLRTVNDESSVKPHDNNDIELGAHSLCWFYQGISIIVAGVYQRCHLGCRVCDIPVSIRKWMTIGLLAKRHSVSLAGSIG